MEQVKKGYKKTDTGLIPEDWEVFLLENICEKISVGLATSVTKYYRNMGVPIVRNLNIKEGYFDDSDMLYLDADFAKSNLSKAAKALDVITVRTGSNIGLTCVLPSNYNFCQTFTTLITTPKREKLDSYYLNFHMNSSQGKKEISRLQVGGGKGNLNTGDLKRYIIQIPPTLSEQKDIATALSNVDELIDNLEKLIEKKKAIKQGAIQQLLTPPHKGGKRLDGFSGDWKEEMLFEKVWFQEGPGVRKYQFTSVGVKLLNGTNINNGELDLSTTKNFISDSEANGPYKHFLVDDGDILIACSGISIDKFDEKVTVAREQDLPLCMNTSTMRFKMRDSSVDNNWFYHYLKSSDFKKQIGGQATGSAQLNFGPSHISKVVVYLPSSFEQKAISKILTDMDIEISKLISELSKFMNIKLGMMQELLTGRTRLIY
jgi:type I restriction enzyme S subunit